jgi:SAM-dependent methyltransferase
VKVRVSPWEQSVEIQPIGTRMALDGLLGGRIGYWALRRACLHPGSEDKNVESAPESWEDKLERDFGSAFKPHVFDKVVLDYGCGYGQAAIAMARMGARLVIGTDIREDVLNQSRASSAQADLTDKCIYLNTTDPQVLIPYHGKVDVIVSVDAFEHYTDPEGVLLEMSKLVSPGGSVFISFGPPWWHPYGCHMMLMGAPPWSHILFKEKTIMAVRSLHRSDGAGHYEEVEGGLNRMTIRRFEHLVVKSKFRLAALHCVPIRRMAMLARNRWGREFFTSMVRAQLVKP